MNKLVSISQAINKALDNMGMEDDREIPVLIDWAMEAEDKIDSFYSYVERINVLDVDDCSAKLPCGTKKLVGILFGDHGCDCGTYFGRALTVSSGGRITAIGEGLVVIDVSSGSTALSGVGYKIQNHKIVFDSNFGGDQKITVKTLGYEIDEDGFPMVNENHIVAIAAYLEWRLMNRSKHKPGGVSYSRGDMIDQERYWNNECSLARANDDFLSREQYAQLAALYNDPLTGFYQPYFLRHPGDNNFI